MKLISEMLAFPYTAYVDVFIGNSPKYSYVRAYEGVITEIVEKKQISPYASSGLYGFESGNRYLEYYDKLQSEGELYISNVIQSMITDERAAFMNGLSANQETIVLGSPQEYGIELARQTLGAK